MNAIVLLLPFVLSSPIPKKLPLPPTVDVEFLATELKDGDPMVFAVTIKNPSDENLLFKCKPSSSDNNWTYEIRNETESKFRHVKSIGQQNRLIYCFAEASSVKDYALARKSSIRFHTCIRLDSVTDMPVGKYIFRVTITHSDGVLVSREYTLNVTERSEKGMKVLDSLHSSSCNNPLSIPTKRDFEQFTNAGEAFKGTAAGLVIGMRTLAYRASSVSDEKDLDKLLASTGLSKMQSSTLQYELTYLAISNSLLSSKRAKLAEQCLKHVNQPSVEHEQLMLELEYMNSFSKKE